jgi:hypothetical protein
MKKSNIFTIQLFLLGVIFLLIGNSCRTKSERDYQSVLKMNPVGYWPIDEGTGQVIYDRTENKNNGVAYHVPWDKETGLVDFTGAYQWLQIPKNKVYQTESFTLGGWVFLRRKLLGSDFTGTQGMMLMGNAHSIWMHEPGIQIDIRKDEVIDIVSGGLKDVLGTRLLEDRRGKAKGDPIALGEWHHIIYAFKAKKNDVTKTLQRNAIDFEVKGVEGTGTLYLNGQLVKTEQNVFYDAPDIDIQIGSDALWWHQMKDESGSLYGAVRHMVWFDRTLTSSEIEYLHQITNPTIKPSTFGKHSIIMDGFSVEIEDIANLTSDKKRLVLDALVSDKKYNEMCQDKEIVKTLEPILIHTLEDEITTLPSAKLLMKLNTETAHFALQKKVDAFVELVEAKDKSEKVRAEAALALAEMGEMAKEATERLVIVLNKLTEESKGRLPRVEDMLRNSLIRALFDIDPKHPQVSDALATSFVKPLLETVDLSKPYFTNVKELLDAARYMDAFDIFRKLPLQEYNKDFFTSKPLGSGGDYTGTAINKGVTYKVGTGIAWKGVEKISPEEFIRVVNKISGNYPEAKTWYSPNEEHLYRVPIIKIYPDGKEEKIYLEGKDFVLYGADAKVRAWAIFIDKLGYVHVVGGQHNSPVPKNFIPGSWEKLGLSKDTESQNFPAQMYWVSTKPGDINTLKFCGRRNDPRSIPTNYLNYMNFLQNAENETILYGRSMAYGLQCWGMYSYDAEKRRWSIIGGDPFSILEEAYSTHENWSSYLHHPITDFNWTTGVPLSRDLPTSSGKVQRFAWAWQPAFYNFCRSQWGAQFDKTGRLHVHMPIGGLNKDGYQKFSRVYAWSDDRGKTFHRADGTTVVLPLTINPAPKHNADIVKNSSEQWWDIWTGLLRFAGYQNTYVEPRF